MNSRALILIFIAFVGCVPSFQPAPGNPVTAGVAATDEEPIAVLGDKIASLSLTEAKDLSEYLAHVQGIVPPEEQQEGSRRSKDSFDPDISALGERIASLSLADATALSKYLGTVHGIKAAK